MTSQFSLLLDELDKIIDAREESELRKAVEVIPDDKPKFDWDALNKSIYTAEDVSKIASNNLRIQNESAKAERLAKENAEVDARNAARQRVNDVLAKALELNRLGRISATDVARIEISANEFIARIK